MKTVSTYFLRTKFALTIAMLIATSATGIAQINYYVSTTGNNANSGLSAAAPKLTIAAAFSVAADGDIVNLADGTYNLTTTFNFNKSVSIVGQTETGVIIDGHTIVGGWILNPNRSNISLRNFTVKPNGTNGGFPIHVASNTGSPLPVISNISLSHITIKGSKKTAFDFNGVNNLSVSYLTATNSVSGNGVQVSGCRNVNAGYITTVGNAWGGFAIYVSTAFSRGSDNVLIDATTSSFAEPNSIYNQNESGYTNTNLTVNGYDYTVQNTAAVGYTYYFPTKPTALAFAAAIPNPAFTSVKQLSTGQWIVTSGMKIQTAINAANPGDLINVDPGTYAENITVNKSVEIRGSGQALTKVIPALSNTYCNGSSLCAGASNVFLVQASNVTIDQLTVDGDNPALTSGKISGGADIDARNGIITDHTLGIPFNNLNVHHVTVKNIFLRGIYASSGGTFNFDNNTVSNVQADGGSIALFNFGGSGSFTNNTVSDAADGIVSNWSKGTVYTGNTITNSGSGIHTDNNGGSGGVADLIQNNRVSNSSYGGYGIWVFAPYQPVTVKDNSVSNVDVGLAAAGQQAAVTTVFSGNTVDGQGKANSTGVYITTDLFGYGTSNNSTNFFNNTITNNTDGFYLESESGKTLSLIATNNSINNNSNSHVTQATGASDAGLFAADMNCNWWGTALASAINTYINGSGVTHSSWLASGIDLDASAPGFQPAGACAGAVSNAVVSTVIHITCYGASTGSVTISFANGIGASSYVLDGGSITSISGSPFTINGLAAGSHSVVITDAGGNAASVNFDITQPAAALSVNFTFTPILCNGGLSTQNVVFTGGTAPYTMTNQSGGLFISGASEGITYGGNTGNTFAANYVYTVTDANGCTYSFNANITQPAPITVNYSATPILCNGGLSTESITINGGTAPYTVKNQGGGALIIGANSGTTYHGSTYSTIYNYTVTDANGCQYRFTANIPEPAKLVVNASATGIVCNGNSVVTVTATGGKAPYTGTGVFSVTSGTYTYTVTDANGCSASTSITPVVITDTEKPTVTVMGNWSVPNDAGKCGADLTIALPVTTDNCTVASVTNNHPSTYFPVGTTLIKWTVTDLSGNVNDTATQSITVIDNEQPVITPVPEQTFCTNAGGTYAIPVLQATDNCSVMVSYVITGATSRSGNNNNATGLFNTGVSTINWSATDPAGHIVKSTTTVTISATPAAAITVSNADAFCNKITLTASTGTSYQWMSGSSPMGNDQQLSLGQVNGDGVYSVAVTVNGCTSTPAIYTFNKQVLVSSYTILATKEIELGENNTVATGSVGVTSLNGEAQFHKNSSVSSPGSFAKAKKITKDGSGIVITNPIYAAATGISLPTMYLNTANTNNLPNKEVAANSTTTVNGNYKNLTLKKGSNTTLTGNTFGTIRVEQGAKVAFTASTINMEKLLVVKGPRTGYSYVRFAPNTRVWVSGSVNIGSQVYINPDNNKVTFYMGDKKSDDEKFTVKGGDTKVTANIYMPNGKLKVTGGYRYGDYGNGRGDCDNDDDDDHYFGQGNSYVYMTGLFIAEEVEGNGKNVVWNSFDCSASPVPLLNYTPAVTASTATAETGATTEEELKITVMPNPSTTFFTLKLESKYATPVELRVMDGRGRVIDSKSKLGSNSTVQIGVNYSSGTYYAELVQGRNRKVVQLVKVVN